LDKGSAIIGLVTVKTWLIGDTVKITTQIEKSTQKRFLQEAVESNETELVALFLRHGLDVDGFDETSWTPSAEPLDWELDLQKKLTTLADLKAKLKTLG
jgi:hypothetical protein